MVCEFYYAWLITPETAHSGVYDLVNSIIDVLYVAYPHGMDFHLQVRIELSVGGVELKMTEFDFYTDIPKSETQKLLVKGFGNFFGKAKVSSISKVIVLGSTDSGLFG